MHAYRNGLLRINLPWEIFAGVNILTALLSHLWIFQPANFAADCLLALPFSFTFLNGLWYLDCFDLVANNLFLSYSPFCFLPASAKHSINATLLPNDYEMSLAHLHLWRIFGQLTVVWSSRKERKEKKSVKAWPWFVCALCEH